MVWFDSAATTLQKPRSVARAMAGAVDTLGSPGRGGHTLALRAAEEAYECRKLASSLFGVGDPERVVFCLNATHALNIALRSCVGPGDRVVISGYEHNAVLRPLAFLGAEIAVAAAPPFEPEAAAEAFRLALTEETKLAVVNHVSNVFGNVQPIGEIAALCRERGIPFIIDASQSAGVLPIHMAELGAAFIAMPGHKGLYGPQGTGLLLCGHETVPLLQGGSGSDSRSRFMPAFLPDRLEAGTHNMPGIAGLRRGLIFVNETGVETICRRETALLGYAAELLRDIPGIRLWTSSEPGRQTGVLSFLREGEDPELTAERLSDRGFALRAGLHCAPLAHETAGSGGTVRLSFSVFNTFGELDQLAGALKNLS